MKVRLLITLLAMVVATSNANGVGHDSKKLRYDKFAVYRLKYTSVSQYDVLKKLLDNYEHYNLWQETPQELTLMISAEESQRFANLTKLAGIEAELFLPNVQSLIDAEQRALDTGDFGWKRYHSLSDIYSWLDRVLAQHANVTEEFVIGQSYEGRNIRGIKISYGTGNPGIFIESNIHAREWITSATATWLINELLTSTDDDIRELAESHDWYIVPVFNIDGFVYTHEKDRMWRKTRRPLETSSCMGVDANRNFDSHWGASAGDSSTDPCAQDYAGPFAASEPEVKALSEFVASIKEKLNIFLALHSYSQFVLSPFGHTTEEFPPNYDDLISVAKAYADAVRRMPYGTEYIYGSSAQISYPVTGSTKDWIYNEQGVKLSYTIELRDTGHFGFILPPVHIIPNSEETLIGILALTKAAKNLGYLAIKY